VVSLDFELLWGTRDFVSFESYRENLLGVRTVVPRLLELFSQYKIQATWATVGMLFFDDREELLAALPRVRPSYEHSPYLALERLGRNESEDPFHFGWSLLEQIRDAGDQEIASHTFSHYYCLEPGQDAETFRADLAAALGAAERRGITLESLVFPCNQVERDYLPLCAEQGVKAYRGLPRSRLYPPRAVAHAGSSGRRALRLADAYVPLSRDSTHHLDRGAALPRNVPASRFLRPYAPRLRHLDPMRVRRIGGELSHAADTGGVYHLWWHPHNFGVHTSENIDLLARILDRFAELRESRGMRSLTMRDAALAAGG
jgi:hypothetical protein